MAGRCRKSEETKRRRKSEGTWRKGQREWREERKRERNAGVKWTTEMSETDRRNWIATV